MVRPSASIVDELLDATRRGSRAVWRRGCGRGSRSGSCCQADSNARRALGVASQRPGRGRRAPRWCGSRRRPRPSARRPSPRRPRAARPRCMRPAAISASALSRLICDHLLRRRRGVMRCRKYTSSCLWRRPSIQPQHNATSITSGMVTVTTPVPFLAIFSHTPSDESWCLRNHVSHAFADANSITGRSESLFGHGTIVPCSSLRKTRRRAPLAFPGSTAHRAAHVPEEGGDSFADRAARAGYHHDRVGDRRSAPGDESGNGRSGGIRPLGGRDRGGHHDRAARTRPSRRARPWRSSPRSARSTCSRPAASCGDRRTRPLRLRVRHAARAPRGGRGALPRHTGRRRNRCRSRSSRSPDPHDLLTRLGGPVARRVQQHDRPPLPAGHARVRQPANDRTSGS